MDPGEPLGNLRSQFGISARTYTENPYNLFNLLVALAVWQDIDVVFAAGNCGQFCPDNRCGAKDREPANSIWGANLLKRVLAEAPFVPTTCGSDTR